MPGLPLVSKWVYANLAPKTIDGIIRNTLARIKSSKKTYVTLVEAGSTSLAIGDAKNGNFFRISASYNGWALAAVAAQVFIAGITGTTTIQLRNVTDSVDVLSTGITIDSEEIDSSTAATPAVINPLYATVATGEQYVWDVDTIQSDTAPKGLWCEATLRRPP